MNLGPTLAANLFHMVDSIDMLLLYYDYLIYFYIM